MHTASRHIPHSRRSHAAPDINVCQDHDGDAVFHHMNRRVCKYVSTEYNLQPSNLGKSGRVGRYQWCCEMMTSGEITTQTHCSRGTDVASLHSCYVPKYHVNLCAWPAVRRTLAKSKIFTNGSENRYPEDNAR